MSEEKKKKKCGGPLGHPPYPGCETGGRPKVHTLEFIENEAEEFYKWMKLPNSIYFKRFAIDRGYSPQRIVEFSEKSEKFAEAYRYAKEWQECVLVEKGLDKTFSGDFTKFVLVNNHGWNEKVQQTIVVDPNSPIAPYIAQANGKSKELVKDDSSS